MTTARGSAASLPDDAPLTPLQKANVINARHRISPMGDKKRGPVGQVSTYYPDQEAIYKRMKFQEMEPIPSKQRIKKYLMDTGNYPPWNSPEPLKRQQSTSSFATARGSSLQQTHSTASLPDDAPLTPLQKANVINARHRISPMGDKKRGPPGQVSTYYPDQEAIYKRMKFQEMEPIPSKQRIKKYLIDTGKYPPWKSQEPLLRQPTDPVRQAEKKQQKKQQGYSAPCTPGEYYDLFYKIVQG